MTKDEAKSLVTKRILYSTLLMHNWKVPTEATVEEVSPSGKYIKLRHPNKFVQWENVEDITVREVLSP